MVGFLQMKFNYRKTIFIYLIPDSPSSGGCSLGTLLGRRGGEKPGGGQLLN